MVPHVGVVGLGVLVLDPSGGGGDGDYVKNNREEQQQGQDPPAAGVGDPTAEHDDRRSEFVERDREEKRSGAGCWRRRPGAVRSVRFYGDARVLTQKEVFAGVSRKLDKHPRPSK